MRNKKTKILALLLSVGFAIPHNVDVLASELEDQEFQSLAEEELKHAPLELNEETEDIQRYINYYNKMSVACQGFNNFSRLTTDIIRLYKAYLSNRYTTKQNYGLIIY